MAKLRCRLELGIDVKPNLAFEAFCRWEQTLARLTSDMLSSRFRAWIVLNECFVEVWVSIIDLVRSEQRYVAQAILFAMSHRCVIFRMAGVDDAATNQSGLN